MMRERPQPFTVKELLQATAGRLLCGKMQQRFAGISIDSRSITPQDLFVAIRGERHDAHDFVESVVLNGVKGLIIQQGSEGRFPLSQWSSSGLVCIKVEDTTQALGGIGAFHRNRSDISMVTITGSNGKTTTRAMTTAVVSQRFQTHATQGNLNNEIGLPLTLLGLTPRHQVAVVEIGMNHPGEIARLADICIPDVGVITNVAPAHLEGLGSIEAVKEAKGELLDKIHPQGTAILNADDPKVMELAQKVTNRLILFGSKPNAAIRSYGLEEKEGLIQFELVLPGERISVTLPTPGRFMVDNALAAAAVGYQLGLSAQEIKQGLETFTPVHGRLNLLTIEPSIHIIDDTYNANPGSMKAAIQTWRTLKKHHRGILILGDMLELGQQSETLHYELGTLAAQAGPSRLYVTGNFAAAVAEGALAAGMDSEMIFNGIYTDIIEDLMRQIRPQDWLLVKGSRGMAMERIINGLIKWAEGR
jgi:UDP-N-acetylmuramoyl-tripeptide--D-alanyl-D-alanine ligase